MLALPPRAAPPYHRFMPPPTNPPISSQTPLGRPRVLVLGAGRKAGLAESAERMRPLLDAHVDVVLWDMAFERDLSTVEADWAIVFGGDGSILRAAKQMGYHQRPMLGVNLGKLGFLADLDPHELPAMLPELCAGRGRVVEHLMFECALVRHDQTVWTELGLNETAVVSASFGLMDVELRVDAEWVTTYSCDGLIVSTPVGSTAHNLSAGGPILRQDLDAFVIAPIGPHTLTMRPLVDSAERTYELKVPAATTDPHVVVDGRDCGVLETTDRLQIRRAEPRCKLMEAPGHSYYRTLRHKLGWSGSFTNGGTR
jgi:NAD+ kinase